MTLPTIEGMIRRRILVNFRVDPEVMQAQLPPPFRPKLHQGHAIAGICFVRLEEMRPRGFPAGLGLASENAAHRVAVVWDTHDGQLREGVFIPRRDTGSLLNHLAGGRIFPGEHHRARFSVREEPQRLSLSMRSDDGAVAVSLRGRFSGDLPRSSCFASLSEASAFFEAGSLGYSLKARSSRLDGLELETHGWRVEPLQVEEVASSYFADAHRFPPGAIAFDCALVMRNVRHQWHAADDLPASRAAGT
jgi:Uncharacterized conserved protein (COG2071)